jgi:hypothetical protein
LGFSGNGQFDLAQTAIIDEDGEVRGERPALNRLDGAFQLLDRLGSDLEGGLVLRTEGTVLPSTRGQSHDADNSALRIVDPERQ